MIKKNVLEFLHQDSRGLVRYSLRIFLILPIYMFTAMSVLLSLLIWYRGGRLGDLFDFVPIVLKLSMVVSLASFIHMIIRRWQNYCATNE